MSRYLVYHVQELCLHVAAHPCQQLGFWSCFTVLIVFNSAPCVKMLWLNAAAPAFIGR